MSLPPELFADGKVPAYALTRSHAGATRLNLQHYMFSKAIGYTLHPDIPRTSGMVIGEVACGTGIWLLDLVDEVPSDAILEGWDISDAQFPSKELLPENMKLGTLDSTGEVPPELVGRYDAVSFSLVVCAIREDGPGKWIENVKKMCKPGGHIQWREINVPSFISQIRTSPNSPTWPACAALQSFVVNDMKMFSQFSAWVAILADLLKEHGLEILISKDIEPAKRHLRVMTELFLHLMEEFGTMMGNARIFELVGKAAEEVQRGAVASTTFPLVIVARKPKDGEVGVAV